MSEKLTFKRVEIPLSKFNNVAIPHHLELLKKHKHNIIMYQKQHEWDRVRIEQNNASRLIKQLKQLLYEMDMLRSQVQDSDVDKFDANTIKSRQTVQNVITDYLALISKISALEVNRSTPNEDENNEIQLNIDPLIIGDIEYENEIINEKEECLRSALQLQRNLEDLQTAFVQLHQIVHEQGELVEKVEENIEVAAENVHEGAVQIAKAASYKRAMYPITGAAIGTCIGGPIGFVAGLKLGGLAAIGCGITGYFGGKLLKEQDEKCSTQIPDSTNQNEIKRNKIL